MATQLDLNLLAQQIKQWGTDVGFQQIGICDTDLTAEEPKLQQWLDKQYQGEMDWMARHGMMRARPHELLLNIAGDQRTYELFTRKGIVRQYVKQP